GGRLAVAVSAVAARGAGDEEDRERGQREAEERGAGAHAEVFRVGSVMAGVAVVAVVHVRQRRADAMARAAVHGREVRRDGGLGRRRQGAGRALVADETVLALHGHVAGEAVRVERRPPRADVSERLALRVAGRAAVLLVAGGAAVAVHRGHEAMRALAPEDVVAGRLLLLVAAG